MPSLQYLGFRIILRYITLDKVPLGPFSHRRRYFKFCCLLHQLHCGWIYIAYTSCSPHIYFSQCAIHNLMAEGNIPDTNFTTLSQYERDEADWSAHLAAPVRFRYESQMRAFPGVRYISERNTAAVEFSSTILSCCLWNIIGIMLSGPGDWYAKSCI